MAQEWVEHRAVGGKKLQSYSVVSLLFYSKSLNSFEKPSTSIRSKLPLSKYIPFPHQCINKSSLKAEKPIPAVIYN